MRTEIDEPWACYKQTDVCAIAVAGEGNTVVECLIAASEEEALELMEIRRPGHARRLPRHEAAAVIAAALDGREGAIELCLDGTEFQKTVWRSLRTIPRGEVRTYGEIASSIGRPGAHRAVANACAANRIAVFIPCHRVVPATGGPGEYAWGGEAKKALLEMEKSFR
jgi:O-6-methylguanine DNA methyltransferase